MFVTNIINPNAIIKYIYEQIIIKIIIKNIITNRNILVSYSEFIISF